MKRLIAAIAGLCLLATSAIGFYQSRDSNYNIAIVSGGGGGTPAFNWITTTANSLGANGTSTVVGVTNASGACSTLTAGDTLMVDLYLFSATSNTITPPSGWTQIGTGQNDGQGFNTIWQHTLGAGEACSSYTFSWTTTSFVAWALVDVTGVGASPIDTSAVNATNTGAGTSIVAGPITTTHAPDYFLLFIFSASTLVTQTAPSDMTSRFSGPLVGTNMIALVSDSQHATTVSSFSETVTGAPTAKAFTYGLVALHN